MKRRRSFWKWLYLWARAGAMADASKKRIMRENLETWNRDHRAFINKCDRETERRVDRCPYTTSVDESSAAPGCYGSDCGDC